MMRLIGLLAGLVLGGVSAAQAAMIPIAGDPVQTEAGKVSGTLLPSGVKAYLGIPYAAPPVQALRWTAPHPLRWEGIWNADRTGPECVQILRPHNVNHYFSEEPTSEDCLYLNIWTPPNTSAGAKLPVVVFIYGGGGTVGSSGMAVYGGEHVAEHGAIFVSFNYRVGILGYMAHAELTQEQGGHSGNYGYLDQNAALKWLQENISRFGGDPAKVIITGQSFGASSVAAQLFSPLSKGLFRAAAMWSACNFTAEPVPLTTAEATGRAIQQRLGAADIKEMREIAADKILALQEEHQLGANVQGLRLPPAIDGLFWTADKITTLSEHKFNEVPFIAGSNGDDLDSNRSPLTTAQSIDQFKQTAQAMYGPQSGEFLKWFPVRTDADVPRVAHEAAREIGFLHSSTECATLQSRYNTSAAYIEVFTRKHPYVPGVAIADQDPVTIGAYHTADVPYWFGTFDAFNKIRPTREWTADDRRLSDSMMAALIAMARTGNPSLATAAWPAWTAESPRVMEFGDGIKVETLNVARMKWLAAHPPADVPRTGKPRTTRD